MLTPKLDCSEPQISEPSCTCSIPQECLELLRAMLTPNPAERITLDGIMQHPWCAHSIDVTHPLCLCPSRLLGLQSRLIYRTWTACLRSGIRDMPHLVYELR